MDTRQLRSLSAIKKYGTFAKAAAHVNLTPAAVGQQIAALEQELGIELFDRTTRPPTLTPLGLQVLEMANEVLRLEEDTKSSLRGDRIAGTLVIGSVRSSAVNLLPAAMVEMRHKYPFLKTNLRIGLSANLVSDVESGHLDAAIVAEHVGIPSTLRWSPFLNEPLWIVANQDTPISNAKDMLNTLPFIRFRSAVPLANLIDTEISRMGVTTQDVAEIDMIGTILTCVRHGLGISVVPHVALMQPESMGLQRIPFGNPQLTRQIGIIERKACPRGLVIEELHNVLANHSGIHGVKRLVD